MTPTPNRCIVVADSGPIIGLSKIGLLDVMSSTFDEIHIPQAIFTEVTSRYTAPNINLIQAFIRTNVIIHPDRDDDIYHAVKCHGNGEGQAISLACALGCGALIDDLSARKAAMEYGVPLYGIFLVLMQAKKIGEVDVIAPSLNALVENGYFLSKALIAQMLKLAGETQD